jgi:hypothetical protein
MRHDAFVYDSDDDFARLAPFLADGIEVGDAAVAVTTVRAVGEVQFGATPHEWDEWTAYEAILNRALADHPAWNVCPYDSRALPAPVVEQAARTHPGLLGDDWQESRHYHAPDSVVRARTAPPEPVPELQELPLDGDACRARAARPGAVRRRRAAAQERRPAVRRG